MSKIVLFSPVGGTDPISNSNCQDGALLHICRVYKPDMVYMYLSEYTLACEAEDSRYSYCLNKLSEKIGKDIVFEKIERPDLDEVQDFDYFYDDFKNEINRILDTLEDDDVLYLNTSSGTPAMKSALVVLATLGDVDASLIQVTTPDKKINKHDHDNYDVKKLWDLNPDNSEGFENRCKVFSCPSLLQLKNEELLKKLIRSYDYYAALEVVKMMPKKYTANYKHLVEYAYYRITLNNDSMCRLEQECIIPPFLPVREENSQDVVEYALTVFVKAQSGDYAEFVRSITPLIVELFVLVVKKISGINPYDYCVKDAKNGWVWSEEKLNSNAITREWIEIWNKGFGSSFRMGYIDSQCLLYIIKAKGNETEARIASSLRRVEYHVRNIAAHQITAVTNESVKNVSGKTCGEIVRAFKSLFKFTGLNLPEGVWNSYKDMNECIIERINHNA